MAKVLRFVAGSPGDTSSGIFPTHEEITVIFEHSDGGDDLGGKDDAETLKSVFGEMVDGKCVTYGEYQQGVIHEAVLTSRHAEESEREGDVAAEKLGVGAEKRKRRNEVVVDKAIAAINDVSTKGDELKAAFDLCRLVAKRADAAEQYLCTCSTACFPCPVHSWPGLPGYQRE